MKLPRIGIILASIATLAVVAASGVSIYSSMAVAEYRGDRFYAGDPHRAYASFACHERRSTIDWHCLEDWNVLNVDSGPPLGYASADLRPTINASVDVDHFAPLQSRPILNGTGDITRYWDGANVELTHNGTGVVYGGSGLRILTPKGAGVFEGLAGITIENQARAGSSGLVSHNSTNYLAGVQTDRLDVAATLVLPRRSAAQLMEIEGPEGALAFGNDACKPGQFAMLCDGAPVYWSRGDWRTMHDGRAVMQYRAGMPLGK